MRYLVCEGKTANGFNLMTSRSFEIQARLRAADGKWLLIPSTWHVSASSLEEFTSELHKVLLGKSFAVEQL